ncbi:hypothetical protein FRC04_002454 [Tulasnella sp. 424]|nr:hypothetical protein FRC04_002454 [Tulasnella sp. 424]KAG8967564.1 hypothetical protein FRC05_001997 [Tulasnella sp. 425]
MRLKTWADALDEHVDLVHAMGQEGLSEEWVQSALDVMQDLINRLRNAADQSARREDHHIGSIQPILIVRTGRRGRPRKAIDPEYLRQAFKPYRRINITRLAKALDVDRKTLKGYMDLYGISKSFSEISSEDIDALIRNYKLQQPNSGLAYIIGYLRSLGLRVQRHRVIDSIRRVDQVGTNLRVYRAARRRTYRVARPNSVWHCDGHHKLIRWGFVIHGFIDGFCRTIVALRASTSNSATTVLRLFKHAVRQYGRPLRVRGDRGGENVKVAVNMIRHRGVNRASFMWGSSTHNTRIERIWVEVGKQFARRWRAFFTRLENQYHLDVKNQAHVWLLQVLFLDAISADCKAFVRNWNLHGIRGEQTRNMAPIDLRFLGQQEHGVYLGSDDEEFPDADPQELQDYLGVEGPIQRTNRRSGAGHASSEDEDDSLDNGSETGQIDSESWTNTDDSSDSDFSSEDSESDSSDSSLAVRLEEAVTRNIRHRPVRVRRGLCPFLEDGGNSFLQKLDEVRAAGIIPPNFGFLEGEEGFGEYEPLESIRVGKRWVDMELPHEIWEPRTIEWVQALQGLTTEIELS